MKNTLFALLTVVFLCNGCSQLKTIQDTLSGLKRLEYKLKSVNFFRVAGIEIDQKASISDFSPLSDGLSLLNAYRSKSLPVTFILNMDVKNPNDGSGGSKSTTATLKGLDFRLLVDDRVLLNGDIQQAFEIPANGTATTIPIAISADLLSVFSEKSYTDIMDLALAIGGKQGNAGRLTLDIKPTVNTPLGAITAPSRIKVIDKEFRN